MKRASPVDLRSAMDAAHVMAHIGIMFVPMPVLSDDDAAELKAKAYARLEALEKAAEAAE
jgi:hypothetical protein